MSIGITQSRARAHANAQVQRLRQLLQDREKVATDDPDTAQGRSTATPSASVLATRGKAAKPQPDRYEIATHTAQGDSYREHWAEATDVDDTPQPRSSATSPPLYNNAQRLETVKRSGTFERFGRIESVDSSIQHRSSPRVRVESDMSWVQLQMRLFQDKDRRETPGAAAELQRQQLGGGEEQIATQEAFEKSRRLHACDHALNQPAEPHPGKAFMTNQESLRSHWSTLWEPDSNAASSLGSQGSPAEVDKDPSNTSPLVATSTKGLEAPHEAEPALSAPLAVKQATGAGGSKIDGIRAEGRANGAGQVEEIVPARGVQALVERAMVSSDSEDD